jgi:hypothetical protein
MTLIDTEGSQRGADGFADDAESGRNEGARMIGGMIGLWGEKKLRRNANLMSGSAMKTPENERTNPIGGKWARCVKDYASLGWGRN